MEVMPRHGCRRRGAEAALVPPSHTRTIAPFPRNTTGFPLSRQHPENDHVLHVTIYYTNDPFPARVSREHAECGEHQRNSGGQARVSSASHLRISACPRPRRTHVERASEVVHLPTDRIPTTHVTRRCQPRTDCAPPPLPNRQHAQRGGLRQR